MSNFRNPFAIDPKFSTSHRALVIILAIVSTVVSFVFLAALASGESSSARAIGEAVGGQRVAMLLVIAPLVIARLVFLYRNRPESLMWSLIWSLVVVVAVIFAIQMVDGVMASLVYGEGDTTVRIWGTITIVTLTHATLLFVVCYFWLRPKHWLRSHQIRPALVRSWISKQAPSRGQVWWANIPYEESNESKDRPCMVLSASDRWATVWMFTSQDKTGRRNFVEAPSNMWRESKISFLRTDREIKIPLAQFRSFECDAPPELVACLPAPG